MCRGRATRSAFAKTDLSNPNREQKAKNPFVGPNTSIFPEPPRRICHRLETAITAPPQSHHRADPSRRRCLRGDSHPTEFDSNVPLCEAETAAPEPGRRMLLRSTGARSELCGSAG